MVLILPTSEQRRVRVPPVRGKQWLASMESSVNFRGEKAWKRLMPLAFRQWHLYRFAIMVPVVGLEPTRCRHQRILSPSRLPFHHTGENSCLLYRKQNRNSREISITSGAFKKEHHREDETGNGVVQKWRENRERGYTNQGKRAIIHKLKYLKRRERGQRDETDMADSASDRTADPFDWADRRL